MKKMLAALLSLIMLFALIPATVADGEDFVLEIKGGNVSDHLVSVSGTYCLAVDVYLTGTSSTKMLSAVNFDLTYTAGQLTFKTYEVKNKSLDLKEVNTNTAGTVSCGFTSNKGAVLGKNEALVTLYFTVAKTVKTGTKINFNLKKNDDPLHASPDAEAINAALETTPCTVGTNFKPFVMSGEQMKGTIKFNDGAVQYKGTTPYVVYNGKAQTPAFKVYDPNGKVIDPAYYDYEYKENVKAGTGYVFVTFKGKYYGECRAFFKIYLPATTWTKVENVQNGIKISWKAVEGAAGYVVYRRAWNLKDAGWTTFERWNNTTGTSWVDTKVYAGTRYQYGVKAYFAKRLDPIANAQIGGNVGDNYNLGLVGPLKTTVRITTRVLNSVTPGSKKLTIKWAGSSVFTGYQVQVATDAKFTQNLKTVTISNAKTYETTISGLKAKTTYYVRVRSYHLFEGMTYYGQWSNVLNGKTK